MEPFFGKGARQDFLVGSLLIAMPNMADPRFDRAVIFMCAHTEDHAMGVVVNKPLPDVTFGELLGQMEMDCAPEAAMRPVAFGGPVDRERGFVVHTLDYCCEATLPVTADIGLTATKGILSEMASDADRGSPAQALLALGYAGWGAGQLESEIRANAWAHCPADPHIVFELSADDKWAAALGRLGVTHAMFSPEWSTARESGEPLH